MSLSKFSFVFTAVAFLSGCVVVEEGGHRPLPPPRPDRPQMCPMIYAPVCGERAGRVRTLGNSCQARAEGYRIIYGGECRSSATRPPRPGRPSVERACTREYAPVCARRGNSVRTFSNSCEADNRGYRVIRNRPC